MATTFIKILTYYLIQWYLLFTPPPLCFPGKFMNFSEAVTGGVL